MNERLRYARPALRVLAAVLVAFAVLAGCQLRSPYEEPAVPTQSPIAPLDPAVAQRAMAIQDRATDGLLAIGGVVGTATGFDRSGAPLLLVLAAERAAPLIPASVEGLPVVVKSVDGVFAMDDAWGLPSPVAAARAVSFAAALAPTDRFDRPVPIGVATGNRYYCASGTIGARVRDSSGRVFALSNNHVFALENRAPLNSWILQPGLVETSCSVDQQNAMALLKAFQPIRFNGPTNTIDAALAITTPAYLGKATPADGYGSPKATPAAAAIGQPVQKYGRTTALTHGTVTGINATIIVGYSSGLARFAGQIMVESPTAFILPGDSGSLLVSDPGRDPVGLCFAGNASGTMAFANPIGPVLSRFGVTIDGE